MFQRNFPKSWLIFFNFANLIQQLKPIFSIFLHHLIFYPVPIFSIFLNCLDSSFQKQFTLDLSHLLHFQLVQVKQSISSKIADLFSYLSQINLSSPTTRVRPGHGTWPASPYHARPGRYGYLIVFRCSAIKQDTHHLNGTNQILKLQSNFSSSKIQKFTSKNSKMVIWFPPNLGSIQKLISRKL